MEKMCSDGWTVITYKPAARDGREEGRKEVEGLRKRSEVGSPSMMERVRVL